MLLDISEIKVGRRRRRDDGDIAELARSISEIGLLHPPVVDSQHRLVAGLRRLKAAKKLGWDRIAVTVAKNLDDELLALQAEGEENTCRLAMAPTEALALAEELRGRIEADAKRRQREGGETRAKGTRDDKGRLQVVGSSHKQAEPEAKTRDRVSAAVGTSARTLRKVAEVVEAAKVNPALKAVVEEMDRTGKVDHAHKAVTAAVRRTTLRETALPSNRFRVVYADPPWAYNNSGLSSSAAAHYETMPLEKICELSVANICTQETVLFMWATNPLLPEALQVLAAWGFEYKTNLVWVKSKASGMGWWVRAKHEMLLVGTRKGSLMPEPSSRPDSCFEAPVSEHSRKPDIVYTMIEKACVGPYIELFSRRSREGWTSWGNEV